MDIIKKYTDKSLTIYEVKVELFKEYKKYFEKYKKNILDILILQGKKTICNQLKENLISLETFIFNDNYYLTNLDFQILLEKYKIPSIFISNKLMLETNYNEDFFVVYSYENSVEYTNYFFIVTPSPNPEKIPNYKVILDDNNDTFISIRKLTEKCLNKIISSIENTNTEYFISKFKKDLTTKYKPRKKGIRKLLNFVIEDEIPQSENKTKMQEETLTQQEEPKQVQQNEEEEIIKIKKKTKQKKIVLGKKTKKNNKLKIIEDEEIEDEKEQEGTNI
jgi:hypothetical protein